MDKSFIKINGSNISIANIAIFHQVGHSIGSYIALEVFKRSPDKVIGTLYVFSLDSATYPSLK